VQRSAITRSLPPSGRIACSGQVSRQAPQPWQAPIVTGPIATMAATHTPAA